eukprot:ctg_3690.g482
MADSSFHRGFVSVLPLGLCAARRSPSSVPPPCSARHGQRRAPAYAVSHGRRVGAACGGRRRGRIAATADGEDARRAGGAATARGGRPGGDRGDRGAGRACRGVIDRGIGGGARRRGSRFTSGGGRGGDGAAHRRGGPEGGNTVTSSALCRRPGNGRHVPVTGAVHSGTDNGAAIGGGVELVVAVIHPRGGARCPPLASLDDPAALG